MTKRLFRNDRLAPHLHDRSPTAAEWIPVIEALDRGEICRCRR